jgi:hypothetical protein
MKTGLESYRLAGSDLMTTQFCLMMGETQSRRQSRGLAYIESSHEDAHKPELSEARKIPESLGSPSQSTGV